MNTRLWVLLLVVLCSVTGAPAQDSSGFALVQGKIQNNLSGEAAADLQVTLPFARLMTVTDAAGCFRLEKVPYGRHRLLISTGFVFLDTITIIVARDLVDLGLLKVAVQDGYDPRAVLLPALLADEQAANNTADDVMEPASVGGLLTASRDLFQHTAAYTFGNYGFRPRGYANNARHLFVNGIPMNDLRTGAASWGQWGGLNDVFRSRSETYGLTAADFSPGGANGGVWFEAAAASQEPLTSLSYSSSDRQYRHRLMLTHSSGPTRSGWSYSISAGKRWGSEGAVTGCFYDAYSYFGSISRQLGSDHQFSLTAFGVSVTRGKTAPVTKEAYSITGDHLYNPNWGYQNGYKRNARTAGYHQPLVILSHQYSAHGGARWFTSLGYQWGEVTDSRLDWYNGADPRPDYYRYLPGWQYYLYDQDTARAAVEASAVAGKWSSDLTVRQVNWDRLYQVNYGNYELLSKINGIEDRSFYGRRSVYVEGTDVAATRKYSFNTVRQQTISDQLRLSQGLSFATQQSEHYKRLDDLLGGDYYVNYNQFAEREYVGDPALRQNDLDLPDRMIRQGDKYGYHYKTSLTKAEVWVQPFFSFRHIEFFFCASGGITSFRREGLYRTGLYPVSSKGFSPVLKFFSYSLKGGLTYKMNGRNYLFLHAALIQEPPGFDHSFISPRTRNQQVAGLSEQQSYSAEAGYLLRTPAINGRLAGYSTSVVNATQIRRFYHDDFESFVNYVITGLSTRYAGLEAAVDYKLTPAVNLNAVAAYGQAFYATRPRIAVYGDNDTSITGVSREVFLSDYYLAAGPQSAYSLGLKYRSRHDWFATINLSYLDRNYADIATERRTADAAASLTPGSPGWHQVLGQEQLPSFYVVDLFFYKSFTLSGIIKQLRGFPKLTLSIGINNLLDRKDILLGGFESPRYESGAPAKFPARYFPGYGRTYFANISLKF